MIKLRQLTLDLSGMNRCAFPYDQGNIIFVRHIFRFVLPSDALHYVEWKQFVFRNVLVAFLLASVVRLSLSTQQMENKISSRIHCPSHNSRLLPANQSVDYYHLVWKAP